jgi:hypothetical protein
MSYHFLLTIITIFQFAISSQSIPLKKKNLQGSTVHWNTCGEGSALQTSVQKYYKYIKIERKAHNDPQATTHMALFDSTVEATNRTQVSH